VKRLLFRLWRDERGEVTYVAVILIYTILGLGAIVGLVTVRNQFVQEFGDLGMALDQLDQSYSVDFYNPACADFSFADQPDLISGGSFNPPEDPANLPPADINLSVPPKTEGGAAVSNTPGEPP